MRKNALLAAAMLAGVIALATLAGCSREKIDWKSAEAADTVEGYDHFIERHPDSALVTQAHARVEQLNEERDWKRATASDSAEGYRQFLARHEGGKWAAEARIRIENFALDGTATGPLRPVIDTRAAMAVPTPAPPGPAAFGIQLGAFHTQYAALKNWKQLQVKYDADLHGLFAHAVPVKQASGQLFRLQAPVGEESRARALCASLIKQSQPCVIVLPQAAAARPK